MADIDVDPRPESGEVIVRSYPNEGTRFDYVFERGDEGLEIVEKARIENPDTPEEERELFTPRITPEVRKALESEGYELV